MRSPVLLSLYIRELVVYAHFSTFLRIGWLQSHVQTHNKANDFRKSLICFDKMSS